MRTLYFIFFSLLLSACATPNTHQDENASRWRGKRIDALIQQLGAPVSVAKTVNHTTYYVYTAQHGHYIATPPPAVAVHVDQGSKPVLTVLPPAPLPPAALGVCITTFEVNADGFIISAHSEGNGCS